jgi:transcriptional regulator with XRE-family HTH domain
MTHRRPGASRLRLWRQREDLSLSDVSALSGFSVSMLSMVERGERQLLPLSKVRLARALRVPVTELFEVEPVDDVEVAS